MKASAEDRARGARTTLLARATELRDRLRRVRADLRREREPLPRDSDDAAIAKENDEVLEALEVSAARELALIDSAIGRIDGGLFGQCAQCGRGIDEQRLQVVPHAQFCRECAPDA